MGQVLLLWENGRDFQSEHMHEALKAKGTSKDELLKAASGGSAPKDWAFNGAITSSAAAGA